MHGTRLAIWVTGVALVVAAVFMLFFETGLAAFVPLGIAVAGLLLIIGVAVMSAAERMHGHERTVEREHVRDEHVHTEHPRTRETTIIERRGSH